MRTIHGELITAGKEKWNHPASCIFSGSSGTGKTELVFKLIRNQHFSKPIKHVFYFGCDNEHSHRLNWDTKLKDIAVTYEEGLPSSTFFSKIPKNSLVVIDDQFYDAVNSSQLANAFTFDRRHRKFSIILITQNLFEKGKYNKTIRNNSEILVLFRNYG